MGTVEKRGKNSWRISTQIKTDHGWEWVRMTLHMDPSIPQDVQHQDAQRELMQLELSLSAPSRWMTLREWSDEWLTKHQPDSSPVTVSNYRFLLDSRILPQLGDIPLQDLTPARLTDWMITVRNSPRKTTRLPDDKLSRPRRKSEKLVSDTKRKKPLSTKTLIHYYTCMSTMLEAAVRVGYLDNNPMDRVQRPKQHKQKPVPFSEQTAVQLLRDIMQVDDEQRTYRTAVLLALSCGIRLGEAGALTWQAVDFINGTIHIDEALKYTPADGAFIDAPKTDCSIREITLPPSILAYLDQEHTLDTYAELEDSWQADETGTPTRWVSGGWIVHGPHGRQRNKDTPSKWFTKFAREHGYGKMTFHDLRHAHASLLAARRVDIAAIAARMGHSDPSTTLANYVHPLLNHDAAAAVTLDDLLAPVISVTDPAGTDPDDTSAQDPAAPSVADPATPSVADQEQSARS